VGFLEKNNFFNKNIKQRGSEKRRIEEETIIE